MEQEKYVRYEYKEVEVGNKYETLWKDCYPSFGWQLEKRATSPHKINQVKLKYKRDRRIKERNQISKLQQEFESTFKRMEKLEFSKTFNASARAYVIGLIGTVFMAAAVFAYLDTVTGLFILFGAFGIIGWVIPYWVYKFSKDKRTVTVIPIIDNEIDLMYELCDKASLLVEGV